ncbi:hypothetical protein IWZ00DRAFT_491836 [Phyllosticta capitalensis]
MPTNSESDQFTFRLLYSPSSLEQLKKLAESPSAHEIKRLILKSPTNAEIGDSGGYMGEGKVYHNPGDASDGHTVSIKDFVLPDVSLSMLARDFAPLIGKLSSLEELRLDTSPYRGMGLPFSASLLEHSARDENPLLVRVVFKEFICEFPWRGYPTTKEATFLLNPRFKGRAKESLYDDPETLSRTFESVMEKTSMAFFDGRPSTVRFESLELSGENVYFNCFEPNNEPGRKRSSPVSLSFRGVRETIIDEEEEEEEESDEYSDQSGQYSDESDEEWEDEDEDEDEEDDDEVISEAAALKMMKSAPSSSITRITKELKRSERFIRELSIVDCTLEATERDFVSLFEKLMTQRKLEVLRFENVRGADDRVVMFDWDKDGVLDNGSMIPKFVEEAGVGPTLVGMISCLRY